ncbi:MAG: hypothetical protein H6553_06915 [Chitinophagales bacterium]|nr:hypothetical protein [Chitinophagales bacterium]
MKLKSSNYIIAIVLAVLITVFSVAIPFFWDTIHTSNVLIDLQQNGFAGLLLPSNLDAGHPPLFYAYLYGFVQVFGLKLWVVHLAMFPFVLLLMIGFQYLLNYFQVKSKWSIVYLVAIPAVATQAILVSYDFAMLALYIAGLCLILKDRKVGLIIITALLALFSLRGIFLVVALYLTQVLLSKKYSLKSLVINFKYYIISIITLVAWLLYHHHEMHYWISNASGWQAQRTLVDIHGCFKNVIAIARTQFDVGILLLFCLNAYIFYKHKSLRKLQLFAIIPFLVLSCSFVLFSNPIGHRYYLVVYALELLPILVWIQNQAILLKAFLFIGLILGNAQIYPSPISNAWDCSLVHLLYHQQKQAINAFIETNHLNKSSIGTVFPIYASTYQTQWKGDTTMLNNVHGQTIDNQSFIIWSNVGNDFSDKQHLELQSWHCIYQSQVLMVQLKLYQNPNKK